jgi:hypothetical protein
MFLKWLVSIFQIRVGLFGCDHPVTLPTIPPLTLPAFVKARKAFDKVVCTVAISQLSDQ